MANDKKVTTIYINDGIYTMAKIFAAKQKKSVSETIEAALLFYIKNHNKIKSE